MRGPWPGAACPPHAQESTGLHTLRPDALLGLFDRSNAAGSRAGPGTAQRVAGVSPEAGGSAHSTWLRGPWAGRGGAAQREASSLGGGSSPPSAPSIVLNLPSTWLSLRPLRLLYEMLKSVLLYPVPIFRMTFNKCGTSAMSVSLRVSLQVTGVCRGGMGHRAGSRTFLGTLENPEEEGPGDSPHLWQPTLHACGHLPSPPCRHVPAEPTQVPTFQRPM